MTEDKYDLEGFASRPLGMRLAMLVRLWRAVIDDAVAATGLTQSSWTVLMQLSIASERVTVSELAKAQGIELPPLTRKLDLLEKGGFLIRLPDESDRRVKFIVLTSEGKRVLEEVKLAIEECHTHVMDGISEQELTLFSDIANKLAVNMVNIRR